MPIKIKLTEKLILKIQIDDDSSFAHSLYIDSFENVSISHDDRSLRNDGNFSKDFWAYFTAIEDSPFYIFEGNKGTTHYLIDLWENGTIRIGKKLENGKEYHLAELDDKALLSFKEGEFGDDEENSLKSWAKSIDALIDGEIYLFNLVEIEKCNLGHIHENEIDSCGGFYGYKNKSEMILEMLSHCIDKKEITYFDDLKKHLEPEYFLKLTLGDICEAV